MTRLQRLQELARERRLAALAIMPGPNLRYLTGMDMFLSERPALLLVPAAGEPLGVCPAFEADRFRQDTGVERVFGYTDEAGPDGAMAAALPGLVSASDTGHASDAGHTGGALWGLEYRQMRLLEREWLARALAGVGQGLAYEDAGPLLAAQRMRKDKAELMTMQAAANLVDEGMRLARQAIRPGVSERAVAIAIAEGLRRAGLQGEAELLVASGPRAAVPHAEASERVMQDGELCWVDLVLRRDGYVADITRTFAVGSVAAVPTELRRAYAAVQDAQARARTAARPGITGADVDAAARGPIAQAGFGERFTHRTGHGIGLDVHEEPYMVAGALMPLEAGMTFTIEPGIYIPGLGGIRIEDDVALVPGGAQVLTTYSRDLTGAP
ncbi:MAG: M24 family metallopeptidase [Symbiobacteriia bacterium]